VFILNPTDSLKRIQTRDKLIPFEKKAFLEKVHNNYLTLIKGDRFIKIDASKSIEEIVDICIKDIKN
jgi:thymidylate kinase